MITHDQQRMLETLRRGGIDRDSGVPLYLQASAAVERVLRQQPLPAGQPLPAETELAATFGISRPTLRQAVKHLTERGVVTVRRGVGAFPSVGVITRPSRASSLYSDLIAAGLTPTTEVIGFSEGRIDPETAAVLGAEPDSTVYRIERLRRANGVPIALMESCIIRRNTLAIASDDLVDRSLYDLIHERTGVRLTHGRETVTARLANTRQAELLGVDLPYALMRLSRVTFDETGAGVESSTNWYANSEVEVPLDLRSAVVVAP